MYKKYIFLALLLLLVFVIVFLIFKSGGLERTYKSEAQKELKNTSPQANGILTEEDIKPLPEPVQKYIRYSNAIGKEKVRNFRVTFDGLFKADPIKDWGSMNAVQYTDVNNSTRLFFMKMKMFGIPVIGLHRYKNADASMLVKIAGLIAVVDGKGQEMNEGETVTVFNDMCILAPASLIDKRIEWQTVDPLTVKATFNNKGIKVSALLYFNDKGELINFVSDDRYYSPTGKTYLKTRWSTPMKEYKDYNGIRISSGGDAVWSFSEGDFCYAKLNFTNIEYNVESLE